MRPTISSAETGQTGQTGSTGPTRPTASAGLLPAPRRARAAGGRWGAAAVAAVIALGGPLAVPSPASASAVGGHDHVLEWNDVLLQAYQNACNADGAPGPLARAGAMVHAAIWDAANSVAGGSNPAYGFYLGRTAAPAGASLEAAIDYAAHDTLVNAFPAQQALFGRELQTELGYLPSTVTAQQQADGASVGQQVAQAMIAARSGDTPAFNPAYTNGTVDGAWRPTDTSWVAATPAWGTLKPFTLTSGTQFRPPLPAGYSSYATLLASPEYAAQVQEVERVGSALAGPADRSADQTQSAFFWANDQSPICDQNDTVITPGTYKPPGQLFETTQIVSKKENLDEFANARLFALVGLSMADASITAWDAKYDTAIQLWRPVTAIQLANPAESPGLVADPTWYPLSTNSKGDHFTPPFPSYVSGHATFAGAWAGVMRDYFGDNVGFTATTQDSHAAGVTRNFSSFTAAATEDGFSRLYLGVHYRWDTEQGLAAGFSVGDFAYQNALKPTIGYQGSVAASAAAVSGSSLTLPVGRAVRAGDTLLVSVMLTNTHSGTVGATDTQGNSYTVVSNTPDGAGDRTLVLASVGVKPLNTTDQVKLSYPTTGEHHASIEEFSGISAVDRSAAATGAAGTPFNSGTTATTSAPNELVFGVAGIQGGETATWSPGFTARPTLFVSDDQLATAYQSVSTTGGYAATGTATHQWMAAAVTLR
ncbi:vanadium-dependent haloperoxidase [Kitasatospora sp. MAP5-34]|uniref:vanadium-dependent haloperoxidase n=1 Tax=Kitasatospora sp. MAP5-34 TaxID=3035102 RepID=UPI00247385EB|nr:vanadium-dependent haloperoxidase [Kitasatospora sp. MAP5-34]MDH6576221.1 hypothetical protein [Kitasatospora sp. MAP5-34]